MKILTSFLMFIFPFFLNAQIIEHISKARIEMNEDIILGIDQGHLLVIRLFRSIILTPIL